MKTTAIERPEQVDEQKPCRKCTNSERREDGLYCKANGKLILPKFEDLCLCRGRLKGKDVK